MAEVIPTAISLECAWSWDSEEGNGELLLGDYRASVGAGHWAVAYGGPNGILVDHGSVKSPWAGRTAAERAIARHLARRLREQEMRQ